MRPFLAAVFVATVTITCASPARAGENGTQGSFENDAGAIQPFAPAYDAWIGTGRRPPHYFRAAVEVLALVALGTTYYWFDPLSNGKDKDDIPFEDRLTFQAFRFDSNLNTTNHLLHPLAGSLVHVAARANGVGLPATMLYDFAQTFAFEILLELKERPSMNDIVYTSFGGMALGELLFRTSDYFSSAPRGGTAQKVAGWSLGFPQRVHMAIDGERAPEVEVGSDSLGFSAAYAHRFGVRYELASLSNDLDAHGLLHRARFDAAIVAMPGFMRPGSFATDFGQGNFVDFRTTLGLAAGLDESDLQVRAALFGYYRQHIERDATADGVTGHAMMLGIGPGLRFQASNWLGRSDQLSTVHLPGAQAEVWLVDGAWSAHFGGETYVDLGALQSLAYPEFVARHGIDGTKSILQRRGYAYSAGAWSRLRAELAWGPASLSGAAGHGYYRSIQDFDRLQERTTVDVPGIDQLTELEAELAVQLGIFRLAAGARGRNRLSALGDAQVRRADRDLHLSGGLVF